MNTFAWCIMKHTKYAALWDGKFAFDWHLDAFYINEYVYNEYSCGSTPPYYPKAYMWEPLDSFLFDVEEGAYSITDIPKDHVILIEPNS